MQEKLQSGSINIVINTHIDYKNALEMCAQSYEETYCLWGNLPKVTGLCADNSVSTNEI